MAEREYRWFACAVPIGELGVSNEAADAMTPKWWQGGPCLKTNSIRMDGTARVFPTVRTFSQPPAACYEGPITRKANSGQGRGNHPYLVAVDMSELLGWRQRVENYIYENLPIWPHVSGVLTFERRFWTGFSSGKLYLSRVYVNGDASYPLPPEFVALGTAERSDLFHLFSDRAPPPSLIAYEPPLFPPSRV